MNTMVPRPTDISSIGARSEEHTSELQSQSNVVCRLLLEKKKTSSGPHSSRAARSILKKRQALSLTSTNLPRSTSNFFFNDTATTTIYTLSLHDALPISSDRSSHGQPSSTGSESLPPCCCATARGDRKCTRLNSSHSQISYAVFCLKKKKKQMNVFLQLKKKKKIKKKIITIFQYTLYFFFTSFFSLTF